MKKMAVIAGLALVATWAATSQAQTGTVTRTFGGGTLPAFLAVYDLNGDGVLSQEERDAMNADRRDRHERWVTEWDTNRDGTVAGEECDAARTNIQRRVELTREARFAQADTNADSFLSFEEFCAIPPVARLAVVHPDAPQAIFDGLDANDDSLVSLEEFTAQLRQHDQPPLEDVFRRADTNTNGTLSLEEFAAIPAMVELAKTNPEGPQQCFTRLDTDSSGGLTPAEFLMQRPPPSDTTTKDPFAEADKNADGFLVPEEFNAIPAVVDMGRRQPDMPRRLFESLDVNKDGKLSPVEFLLMPVPQQQQAGQ